jgi:predicted Fe-S protein YdhL (DUF1289 family)
MRNKPPQNVRAGYPPSPCNRLCTLNDNGYCIGCKRSMQEITAWSTMSPAQQRGVITLLKARQL